MTNNFTLAIIAGGKSSRMGANKAFTTIGGQTIIERILTETKKVPDAETIIVTNTPDDYQQFKLPMFADVVPDSGSLGGIYTAIHHSKTHHTFVVACDMPFISMYLIQFMRMYITETDGEADVIVPTLDGYPQGLCAIYSKNCLVPIRKKIDAKRLKVIGFYDNVTVTYLDEATMQAVNSQGIAYMNVNTPEDLAAAREIEENDGW